MKIASPFESIKLSQTKPGDLIRIAHSLAPLGVIIHEQDGKRVVGVLHDTRNVAPYHIVYERDFACFRYTAGWILELPREQATFGSSKFSALPGVANVGPTGTLLNFAPPDPRENELTVNLNTFGWDDIGSSSAAFPHWRIWASEAEMLRVGATPIFSFSASLPDED